MTTSLRLTFLLYTVINTIAKENDCRDNFGSNCWRNSTKCTPYTVGMDTRCDYIECCCKDQLGDPLLDYLKFEYCNKWSNSMNITPEICNAILLTILAIYYFLILSNIADDYFALIMADTSDTLGLSHNIAGVTFLAFGNGAPDISSSVAAIQHGPEQTKLGIGALLGAAVFDPILVSAVIATYAVKKPPQVARRPFVRDCIFLFMAATFVLIITIDGTVGIEEAMGMVILYIVYVGSAILTEIYMKLKKKQKELKKKKRKDTLTNKIILPALGLFSNESMRQIPISTMSGDDSLKRDDTNNESLAGGTYQSFGFNQQISTQGSIARIGGTSPNRMDANSFPMDEDVDNSDSMEKMSDVLSDILDEKNKENKHRHWSIKILLFILLIPTTMIDYLCKITIPLTDEENWNDYLSIITCITSPLWILFGFGIFREEITNGIKMWYIGLIIGILMSLFTVYFVRQKYNQKQHRGDTLTRELTDDDMESDISSQMEMAIKPKLSSSMRYNKYKEYKKKQKEINKSDKNKNCNDPEQQSVMRYYFLFLGFLSAVSWINLAANELVNILTTLGIVSNIDLAILGLTVLAWGNSIGDLVADVGVTKKGYPKMGIAAATAGPTLNILIGVGLGTTIVSIKNGSADLPISENIFYGCIGVMIGISIYCITVSLSSWRLNRYFGYFLYAYYIMFLVVNVAAYRYPKIFFDFGL